MAYVENLRTFIRSYELGSMSAAARDLRISAAVASSRIGELERHLGVRLFNRTTRQLKPTQQGTLFYDGAIKILDTISKVEANIADITANPKGTIFISAPLGLGKSLIAPLIPKFRANYPNVNVRLRLSDRRVDITAEGLDAAFILGELSDSDLRVRPIHTFSRVLCAAPSYIERYGMPQHADDLLNNKHHCLMLRYPGLNEFFWTLNVKGKTQKYEFTSPLESDDGDVLTQWALSGNGIVNKIYFEVCENIEAGELCVVAPGCPPTSLPFSCIYPHKRLQDPKVRLFINFIVEECKRRLKET